MTGLRLGQLWQATRLELRRILTFWGAVRLLFLAFAPTFIVLMHALHDEHRGAASNVIEEETLILAGIVQFYYMRVGLFFGCLMIFIRLVRGELAERTLHYAFLAPVRREVVVVGRFLAGLLTTATVFGMNSVPMPSRSGKTMATGRPAAISPSASSVSVRPAANSPRPTPAATGLFPATTATPLAFSPR